MRDNAAISQLLDKGLSLEGRLIRRVNNTNPWERLRFAVLAEVQQLPAWNEAAAKQQLLDVDGYLHKYNLPEASHLRSMTKEQKQQRSLGDDSQLPGYVVVKS